MKNINEKTPFNNYTISYGSTESTVNSINIDNNNINIDKKECELDSTQKEIQNRLLNNMELYTNENSSFFTQTVIYGTTAATSCLLVAFGYTLPLLFVFTSILTALGAHRLINSQQDQSVGTQQPL